MDENEIVRAIGGLLEFKNQALEKFKGIDAKFEQVYDIKTTLELIKQEMHAMKDRGISTDKKIEDTAVLIAGLSDKFDELKNAPGKGLLQKLNEGKKSIFAVFLTLSATGLFYFIVRVITYLIENTSK